VVTLRAVDVWVDDDVPAIAGIATPRAQAPPISSTARTRTNLLEGLLFTAFPSPQWDRQRASLGSPKYGPEHAEKTPAKHNDNVVIEAYIAA